MSILNNPKDHSAAYKIYHYRWEVWVPQHFIVNEYNPPEIYGSPSSGDAKVDRALAESPMKAHLTIAQMAKFFEQGANFRFHEQKKTADAYKIVHQHLTDWNDNLRRSPGLMDAPVEELRMLDNLAKEMYRIGHFYMDAKPSTGLNAALDRLGGGSRRAGMRRHNSEEAQEKRKLPQEHESMADAISKQVYDRTNRYK